MVFNAVKGLVMDSPVGSLAGHAGQFKPFAARLTLAAALLVAAAPAAVAQSITDLGHLPGATYAYGFGASSDGLAAIGFSDRAFRWTATGGMQSLGTMPGGVVSSASAASDDGRFITGNGDSSGPFYTAFRWSSAQGMVSLGTLGASSYGTGISADGEVVAGYSIIRPSGSYRAFRWTAAAGMEDLGTLPDGNDSRAQGVSADGSVIVGYSSAFPSGSRAFRWTSTAGMVNLGLLPGGTQSYAYAVNSDGSAVAGMGTDAAGASVAFRWTAEEGVLVSLGTLPTGTGSFANAISSDGATIVGRADAAGFQRAFLWAPGTGLVDLNVYLPTLGLNLTGWVLNTANGVSANGRVIVGSGTFNGIQKAWIVNLPGCGTADFNNDGDSGTDADIEAFFACLAGNCCSSCHSADFNSDGDTGTDADIEAFFRVLSGGNC